MLYTNELATGTMSTMRKVEKFLGVAPHSYDEEKAVLVFNSRECYVSAAGVGVGSLECWQQRSAPLPGCGCTVVGPNPQPQPCHERRPNYCSRRARIAACSPQHWHCAKSRNEIREARSRERDPMLDATPFGQASARLVRFFRPHMQVRQGARARVCVCVYSVCVCVVVGGEDLGKQDRRARVCVERGAPRQGRGVGIAIGAAG